MDFHRTRVSKETSKKIGNSQDDLELAAIRQHRMQEMLKGADSPGGDKEQQEAQEEQKRLQNIQNGVLADRMSHVALEQLTPLGFGVWWEVN
ncbi:hypothetical protein R1flu_022197 [Riccia fluitans]|uniref:Uncharacterized protein n=1 Tax=Riccia fluitans TaxID=41844 RepID=A0ABD1ZUF1_9MARC